MSEYRDGATTGRAAPFDLLTRREQQVLLALMRGSTAREISREAYVSLPTVRSHIRSVLSKLGVSTQLAAVVLAYRSGWPGNFVAREQIGGGDGLAAGL
jgi:DNA-binding NarL/FixJ family response regulator